MVVLLVAVAAIPSLGRTGRPVIDYPGILFVGLGATGPTLATSWGGTTYPWSSPAIIGLFVASVLALAIFVRSNYLLNRCSSTEQRPVRFSPSVAY